MTLSLGSPRRFRSRLFVAQLQTVNHSNSQHIRLHPFAFVEMFVSSVNLLCVSKQSDPTNCRNSEYVTRILGKNRITAYLLWNENNVVLRVVYLHFTISEFMKRRYETLKLLFHLYSDFTLLTTCF